VVRMLQVNPEDRITVAQALEHPWVVGNQLYDDLLPALNYQSLTKFIGKRKFTVNTTKGQIKEVPALRVYLEGGSLYKTFLVETSTCTRDLLPRLICAFKINKNDEVNYKLRIHVEGAGNNNFDRELKDSERPIELQNELMQREEIGLIRSLSPEYTHTISECHGFKFILATHTSKVFSNIVVD